jgi:GxxExxY protein
MPITCTETLNRIEEPEFRKLDWILMGCAFDAHCSLGNLVREEGYKKELMLRVSQKGLKALCEVPFRVSFNSFCRIFYCDLIIENSIIYECKTTNAFHAKHRNQVLHYLFLANLRFGKLLNFALPSMKYEYVSTKFIREERQKIPFDSTRWVGPKIEYSLQELLFEILQDWGAGLSQKLYEDALIHFLGPGQISRKDLPLKSLGGTLCHQPFLLFNDGSILHLSSFSKTTKSQETNLLKLKDLTQSSQIHWINFSLQQISFITL